MCFIPIRELHIQQLHCSLIELASNWSLNLEEILTLETNSLLEYILQLPAISVMHFKSLLIDIILFQHIVQDLKVE